ncbi:uncharacterized protein C4orf19 homolog [Crotalus tigris]|uniref:uncharacterized protein C4orf19 homolog n=1 Tax=Crotalus tigris TaxID=88082 RepID=UPI00192F8B4D|nr:uncharacterized protein C4orf19 homolog [Crotalus tigris]
MGCKCCKMIKSYIFHPQDVQTTAYISEINNYKTGDEERDKFHCKQDSDVLGCRNELPIVETQLGANQCRFNHSKDPLWSYRIPALGEKGLGHSVEKCGMNGIHSSKNVSPVPHNKTQPREINLYSSSGPLLDPPGKRVFQPKIGDQLEILDPEPHPKQTLESSNALCKEVPQTDPIFSIQCALPEIRGKDIPLDSPSSFLETNHVEKSKAVGQEKLSNHVVQINQSTESLAIIHNWYPSCGESDEGYGVWRRSPFSISFEDNMSNISGGKQGESAWEARWDGFTEINGELEEDAEVAEALAALEAATAGEVFEEDGEEDY